VQKVDVRFDVLIAVVMTSSVFYNITTYNPLKINRLLGGTCRVPHQGRRISKVGNQFSLLFDPEGRDTFVRNVA
jgi:hypothetical protein